jgi:hypothetical protein
MTNNPPPKARLKGRRTRISICWPPWRVEAGGQLLRGWNEEGRGKNSPDPFFLFFELAVGFRTGDRS